MKKQSDLPLPAADWLPAVQDWFREVLDQFNFEPHHLQIFRVCCDWLHRYLSASAVLVEHGLTAPDRFGIQKARAEVQIARDASDQFRKHLRELALDVAAPEPPRAPRIQPRGEADNMPRPEKRGPTRKTTSDFASSPRARAILGGGNDYWRAYGEDCLGEGEIGHVDRGDADHIGIDRQLLLEAWQTIGAELTRAWIFGGSPWTRIRHGAMGAYQLAEVSPCHHPGFGSRPWGWWAFTNTAGPRLKVRDGGKWDVRPGAYPLEFGIPLCWVEEDHRGIETPYETVLEFLVRTSQLLPEEETALGLNNGVDYGAK